MAKEMETPKDEGLQGNETIEEAILGLQKEPTPELLAHVLTVIRRRMKEGGQAILSVEPPSGDDQIRIGTVKSADGKVWWAAFTSFDEELKGSSSVKSTFLVSLEQLIHMASETKEISGVISIRGTARSCWIIRCFRLSSEKRMQDIDIIFHLARLRCCSQSTSITDCVGDDAERKKKIA